MKALVCGSRAAKDPRPVWTYLDQLQALASAQAAEDFGGLAFAAIWEQHGPITCLVHGAASGVDTLAENWARKREIAYRAHPAPWHRHGPWCKCPRPCGLASQLPAICKAAGMWRNGEMLRREHVPGFPVRLCIAFPGAEGTASMVRLARAAGIEVLEVGR